jgi:hypothetical protein
MTPTGHVRQIPAAGRKRVGLWAAASRWDCVTNELVSSSENALVLAYVTEAPALIFDRRHGRRFLTYQADRDNIRRDAGDCHEGARTAGAAHPPASEERTCRDDQE